MTAKEILIVEDNEDNSILADKILRYYGFHTVITPHGKAALEYCKTHTPDLILMDLSLPDIDGFEVTRLIRQNPKYQQIPIIAISAHATKGYQETSQEVGLDDFLTKPFLPHDLISMVNKYIK